MTKLLLWGKHATTGKAIHIRDAENGLDCNCLCPETGAKLVARQGDINQWHFALLGDTVCENMGESVLHLLSKEILAENSHIQLPNGKAFYYTSAQIEFVVEDMRIDALLHNVPTAEYLAVEIVVTNPLDDDKIYSLRKQGYKLLKIDLEGIDYNIEKSDLTNILIDQTDTKTLYNPIAKTAWLKPSIKVDPKVIAGPILILVLIIIGVLWWAFGSKKKKNTFRYRYS